jgi:hypothetical protein
LKGKGVQAWMPDSAARAFLCAIVQLTTWDARVSDFVHSIVIVVPLRTLSQLAIVTEIAKNLPHTPGISWMEWSSIDTHAPKSSVSRPNHTPGITAVIDFVKHLLRAELDDL